MAMDLEMPAPQGRGRFTQRYCISWKMKFKNGVHSFSCAQTFTTRNSHRIFHVLHDTRLHPYALGGFTWGGASGVGDEGSRGKGQEGVTHIEALVERFHMRQKRWVQQWEEEKASQRRGGVDGEARQVTLGGVGGAMDLIPFLMNCQGWEGPKVMVMSLMAGEFEVMQSIITKLASEVDGGGLGRVMSRQMLVVGVNLPDITGGRFPRGVFPHKMMLNLLSDLCQTR
ncbi:unnamed protein product [Discosporangium mesarthrocarpum]